VSVPAQAAPAGGREVVEIVRPGLLITVQDRGRAGHGRHGVAPSGAMDLEAHALANQLVGNDAGAPALELCGPGAELHFLSPRRFAISGGDMGAALDGQALPPVFVGLAGAGATLRFGTRASGARVSLAFAGALLVPRLFGSAATDLGGGLLPSGPLGKGARLRLNEVSQPRAVHSPQALAALLAPLGAESLPAGVLRFVPEPGGGVAAPVQEAFARRIFRLSARSNRTGFRFEGQPLPAAPDPDRLSEPLAPGAIQLPPDGLPILLMADRNTTGGYPRLGHLAAVDRTRAAQLWPGEPVRFLPISLDEAVAAARGRAARFARLLAALDASSGL
jgi:biotin-dependent carboxylase-like uncharacterized protein